VKELSYADPDILQVRYDADRIQARVAELGRAISRDYDGRAPVLVSVLKGATPLIADLARAIEGPVELEFIAVSGYGRSGVARLVMDLTRPIEGRHVLLMEDIVDTGLTLAYLLKALRARRPASLTVGTLIDKPARRLADLELRYCGFEAEDAFYVGYGLDFRQRYRNLPYIGVLRPSVVGL
jgi:hypoxanthine phosphoribosyltransferase